MQDWQRMNFPIPTWVASDPAREVALDALGLSWQADQLANALLPDLSVLTRRARYLTFLPWAISRTNGTNNQVLEIHRLEAKLALWAAKPHGTDPESTHPKCCQSLVGRESAQRYLRDNSGKPPSHPEKLFKNTAFQAYRSLLRAFHFIDDSSGDVLLTSEGKKAALTFSRNAHGTCACLSNISNEEKHLLHRALGFDRRGNPPPKGKRRRETYEELYDRFDRDNLFPGYILPFYEKKPTSDKNQVRIILHKAFVWELLCLGLNLAFYCILNDQQTARFADRLRKALCGRPSLPSLTEDLNISDEDAARHVVALLRYGCSLRPSSLGLQRVAEDLAKRLFDSSPSIFLNELVKQHEFAKGSEAWVSIQNGKQGRLQKLSSPRKGLPDRAGLHQYRLAAFAELGEDLNLWR